MEDDWDLHAVVRGCATTTTTTTTSTDAIPPYNFQQLDDYDKFLCFSPDLNGTSFDQELHNLYKPFFPKSQALSPPQDIPISPLSVIGGLQDLSQQQQQPQQQKQKQLQTTTTHTQSPRSKRRKNQTKRVCHVPVEGLSSDMWSWRKYGQKPIKGSPYPRGYYKCSTSKGCLARKQVERNRSDPDMFIVTYTAEHNHPLPTHRNSLAGSTRQKAETTQTATPGDTNKPTCSSPVSPAASLSPATEKMDSREEREGIVEVEDEDDELFGVSDMALSDDFFDGLEELAGQATGDYVSDHFTGGSMQFPWRTNHVTTTAAGSG